MHHLGTTQQLAAFIVNNTGGYAPTPHFEIRMLTGASWLVVRYDDAELVLCSARNPGLAREFKTIDAAINTAQHIARLAGLEGDHAWTGEATRLGPMPEIRVTIVSPFPKVLP